MHSADQPITFVEAMFESQSGFSTTGATVLTNVESPELVPNCILFWPHGHISGRSGNCRSVCGDSGSSSTGKAMMRVRCPAQPRMTYHHQEYSLGICIHYATFNMLTFIYKFEGMTMFDAMCHAFGTMATGGSALTTRAWTVRQPAD